jgi:hypothetical protein
VARRLHATFPTLRERWTPQLGVKTGADDVFLQAEPGPWTRPAVRGRDVSPWILEPRRHLLWTHGPDGHVFPSLSPDLEAHFARHAARLLSRSDYRSGAPWQVFRLALASRVHRVIWSDLAARLAAAIPSPDVVPLNTVYGIATRSAEDACALAALLNSRWMSALASLGADPARGGFRRFNARVVGGLPLPPTGAPEWDKLVELGRRREPADDIVARMFELDATDQRALARVAPAPL